MKNLNAQMKVIHNFNSKQLDFESIWGFFDVPFDCFAIFCRVRLLAFHRPTT